MTDSKRIAAFILERGWLPSVDAVRFLAAGEYNENHVVCSGDTEFVFRVNHGSQLFIDNQISYEYGVLRMLAESGVTPRPLHVDDGGIDGHGVLLMEFIAGDVLEYRRDLHRCAEVFARVHAIAPGAGLIVQRNPVRDIVLESRRLLAESAGEYAGVRSLLEGYADTMERMAESWDEDAPLCIVNTEVNSGNFIVARDRVVLVDWEKAVCSSVYQDLAHFLVATTTLWKTGVRFADDEKRSFLAAYAAAVTCAGGATEDAAAMREKTACLERVILLRALSWCHKAWFEYAGGERPLAHETTRKKIQQYLDGAEWFLS